MSKFAVAPGFQTTRPLHFLHPVSRQVNQDALLLRIERLTARSKSAAVKAPPQHPDANLLRDCEALNEAWNYELMALIVAKRLKTAEAEAIATAAHEATASVVERIETARAVTLDGLKVKARALLWRRNGEPLDHESCEDEEAAEA